MFISVVKRAVKVTSCFIIYLSKEMMNQAMLFLAKVALKKMSRQHAEKLEWKAILGKIALVTDVGAIDALIFALVFLSGLSFDHYRIDLTFTNIPVYF